MKTLYKLTKNFLLLVNLCLIPSFAGGYTQEWLHEQSRERLIELHDERILSDKEKEWVQEILDERYVHATKGEIKFAAKIVALGFIPAFLINLLVKTNRQKYWHIPLVITLLLVSDKIVKANKHRNCLSVELINAAPKIFLASYGAGAAGASEKCWLALTKNGSLIK